MNDRVIKNPNFKNNGELHRSLLSRGTGAKGWPNTHTEVEYLGNGKFAASIGIGHRIFFDKADGNKPKKHKLTDNRPDHVVIQSAKCCVEVYPYYAKYFDVQHEEVRLYEERWVVQRWRDPPGNWFDIGAWNPLIAVEEYSEPAGDVVKVTVTYDTDYGTLTVEYFQRDGNNLKHNVTFKNTSSVTETFRVLQRWAGIVADRVNGEIIAAPTERFKYGFRFEKAGKFQLGENLSSMAPTWQDEVEAARRTWIRHGECNRCGKCCLGCPYYTEEYPRCSIYETRPNFCKEFPWSPEQIKNIPECTYSFEATGVIVSLTKLKPTKLDTHPQGLKADFICSEWTLAQGEELEIDPNTATLDDPTVDGDIHWDHDVTYTRDTTREYVWANVSKAPETHHGYFEWDISGIDDAATIDVVKFRYHGLQFSGLNEIKSMENQPSIQADNNAGNQVIFDDVSDGTEYLGDSGIFPEVGTGKAVGPGETETWDIDPKTDLEAALGNDWFAFGFHTVSLSSAQIYSEDKTDAANPKPTLYVEYTPAPPYTPENKSANMAAKMIAGGFI